ncbi:MAG: DEAD/DEAH box helicase, partial [Flavobacteriales bacterium]
MVECPLESWFAGQGWSPHDFQRDAWNAYGKGEEVLIQAPTGSGKTYAGLGAAIREGVRRADAGDQAKGLQLIWIAPIRALTKEIQYSAQRMVTGMGLDWEVGVRTGDTSSKEKANQRKKMPHILITTPESLHVM